MREVLKVGIEQNLRNRDEYGNSWRERRNEEREGRKEGRREGERGREETKDGALEGKK